MQYNPCISLASVARALDLNQARKCEPEPVSIMMCMGWESYCKAITTETSSHMCKPKTFDDKPWLIQAQLNFHQGHRKENAV